MKSLGLAVAGAVFVASVFSACGAGSLPDRTADGVPVVRPAVDASPLVLQEILRLGDVEGENTLFRVTGLALDPAGELYVLETRGVTVFDSLGQRLRRFGREGPGPGEFRSAQTLQVVRDTVVIGDLENRLHFFTTDGTHVRTRIYQELSAASLATYFTTGAPDGWLLQASGSGLGGWEPGQPLPADPLRTRFALYWLESQSDLRPAGFVLEVTRPGRWMSRGGGILYLEAPFTHGPTWAVDGLGRTHVAQSGDYALDVYAPDGAVLRRVEADVLRIPIDEGLRQRWRDGACRPGAPCPADQAMTLPGPEHLPVVEEIWGFSAGHIAVRRADKKSDPADRRERGPWDLFDPDGGFLGTLAADVRPRWFDGQTLLTVERGEMDIEQVVMYRVR